MLSNLAMVDFDREVTDVAADSGLFYTRYSDDLAFSSGSRGFRRKDALGLIERLFRIMAAHGLRPNATKTVIAPPRARKVVLGLLVDRDRPRLNREFRSRVERLLHGAENPRGGALGDYVRWLGFHSIGGFLNHLRGRLHFARMVEEQYASQLLERFDVLEDQYALELP
jgi:RNA-directed DNA polymerase